MAVLGGGVAGLTAAQELSERGFAVTVFERKAWGGKARSIPVPNTAFGGRRALPGEHSLRGFFGFYQHVPDTMRRIPVDGQPNGAHDNLVECCSTITRSGGRHDLNPLILGLPPDITAESLTTQLLAAAEHGSRLPPHELAFFARRLAVFLTSSDERRYGQWEHMTWLDFIEAQRMSYDYGRIFGQSFRVATGIRPPDGSARSSAWFLERILLNDVGRGADGPVDRVLNAPTNEAWIEPWMSHMRRLGVRFVLGQKVLGVDVRRGRIAGVRIADGRGRRRSFDADWFVCALPVDRLRTVCSDRVLRVAPDLERVRRLKTTWTNGIQFYLREEAPIPRGHLLHVDSPWAVMAMSQAPYWKRDFRRDYGDGQVADCLSTAVSDFDAPGVIFGKPARDCTQREMALEVWAQMKAGLEDVGSARLPDAHLHSWFVDPALRRSGGRMTNDESLFTNSAGSWNDRPEPATQIPNLVLAGDYVRNGMDIATMEGANESARAAVNVILATAQAKAEPVPIFEFHRPPELEAAKRIDADRYRRGLPHLMEI